MSDLVSQLLNSHEDRGNEPPGTPELSPLRSMNHLHLFKPDSLWRKIFEYKGQFYLSKLFLDLSKLFLDLDLNFI